MFEHPFAEYFLHRANEAVQQVMEVEVTNTTATVTGYKHTYRGPSHI